MTRVAIIAAMAGELKPLVRGWQHESCNGVDLWRWRFLDEKGDPCEWIAACAGAGVEAATRAFAEVEKDGPISQVISTGWTGALREECLPGQVYRVSGVLDARTGERFPVAAPAGECWLVTCSKVADECEKQRLATTYSAALVDMEASAVARLAAMRGIPFDCIKGVSDGFRDKLPDFNRFISANGQFHLARFILFVLIRPWHWPRLMRMGENSRKAAGNLAVNLLDYLDESSSIRKRNGYPNLKR
jgi:adenosylhomocysteine nucleosidase